MFTVKILLIQTQISMQHNNKKTTKTKIEYQAAFNGPHDFKISEQNSCHEILNDI